MLTSRELATAILLGLVVVLVLVVPGWRRHLGPSVLGLVEAVLAPRIVLLYASMSLWTTLCVLLGSFVGLWGFDLLKDTLIVFLTLAVPMTFRVISMKSGTELLRRVVVETAGITALLVFYLNLESFPLWAELLLQPFLTFAAVLQVVASRDPAHAPAHKLVTWALGFAALGTFAWVTYRLVAGWESQNFASILRAFLLTLWLPLALLPFLYAVGVMVRAESLFSRFRWLRGSAVPLGCG